MLKMVRLVITPRAAMYLRICQGAVLLLLTLGVVGSAAAVTPPDDGCLTDVECHAHYEQAVQFFEAGRFEAALPEFQAAYARRQMPWLLINIGRTLHRLGRPREALDHYERFRQAESRPDPETQDRLEKYIAQSKALAETPGANLSQSPQSPPPPTPQPTAGPATDVPIYKKWSYKKFFRSDGAGCWNGGQALRSASC
jgi:tetratricopeptide (TPR) repeat protein